MNDFSYHLQEEEIVNPKQAKKRKKINPVGSDSDWPPSVFICHMDHVMCVQQAKLALRIVR